MNSRCEKYFHIQGMVSPWDRTWPGVMAPGMQLSRPGLMRWRTLNLEPGQRTEMLLDTILRYLFLILKNKWTNKMIYLILWHIKHCFVDSDQKLLANKLQGKICTQQNMSAISNNLKIQCLLWDYLSKW